MTTNYTGFGQIGLPTAYAFGGGTIGGPNVWSFSSGQPQLSQSARRAGVQVLPAGALSRQEIRNRPEVQQIIQSGKPYVEAPTQYTLQRDQRGLSKYINPITGQSLGSLMWSGGGWGSGDGKDGERKEQSRQRYEIEREVRTQRALANRGPQPEQQTGTSFAPPERSLGTSAESPLAFTGFGRTIGESAYITPTIPPITPSPIPSGTTGMLTSFGGIPRFPFAGY